MSILDTIKSVGEWLVDQVEAVADWAGDQIDSAYDWLADNVSGLPLHIFSLLGRVIPSEWSLWGAKFFTPGHADSDVNAVMSGSKWSGSTITYALPDSRSDYEAINPSASGYKPLSSETEGAVHNIMASLADFVSVGVTYAGRGSAMIQVAGFEAGSVITDSHGYYPGVPIYGGDTWLKSGSSSKVTKGTYNYWLTMHELGHSLGLKHTHDSASGMPKMSAEHDNTEYSVMSYNGTTNRPQTFMQYDIAALQAMYGADFSANSNNTTYSWSNTTGEMFINGVSQGATHEKLIFLTIWDGGGVDTYDMSNYTDDALIDLSAGGFSRFSNAQLALKGNGISVNGNVYNAFQYNGDSRSLIENAIGGSGNDRIKGNSAVNTLTGNAGQDTLSGFAGSDYLYGGDGSDVLYGGTEVDYLYGGSGDDILNGGIGSDLLNGGAGFDWASYSGSATGVVANLQNSAANTGEARGDVYSSVEGIEGSNFADALTGRDNGTALSGLGGNDTLRGGTGVDVLDGGDGNDVLFGGADGDALYGGAGGFDLAMYDGAGAGVVASLQDGRGWAGDAAGDSYHGIEGLSGTHFNDQLTGDEGTNYLYGRMGDDVLTGNGGNDLLDADIGNDTLNGGAGNDSLYGGDGSDVLTGGAGADHLNGGAGADWVSYAGSALGVTVTLAEGRGYTGIHGGTDANGDIFADIENVEGGNGVDVLTGNAAANHLRGLGSDDILEGGRGADTLDGGAGFNWASYSTATAGVTANLSTPSQNTGDAAGDVYISMHGLQGSLYGDRLIGDGSGNALSGLSGDDTLDGGAGSDILEGGAGYDRFVFSTAIGGGNVDRIADFNVWEDKIELDTRIFTGVFGYWGALYNDFFKIGTGATDWDDRIIYNNVSGELFYDADGIGAGAQVKFAELTKGLALSADSFRVLY